MARKPKDPSRELKRGPANAGDREFLLANRTMPEQEAADKLNRSVEFVRKVRAKLPPPENADRAAVAELAIRAELKNSERWKRLKDEFTVNELKRFEEEYVSLMRQFISGITTTEHIQVFDVVKFELLASRNLAKAKAVREDITRLEKERGHLLGRRGELEREEVEALRDLDRLIHDAREGETLISVEFGKLQERKDALIKSLKGTRDQRIKELHEPKDTVLNLIKKMQSQEFREREGRELGLARLAAKKEYDRLGEVHTFENGEADRPMLSPETITGDA